MDNVEIDVPNTILFVGAGVLNALRLALLAKTN